MKKLLWAFVLLLSILLIALYKADIPAEKIKLKYADTSSRFIKMMGMTVHYKDEGNPADPLPLILIHGTSSSLHTWDSLVLRLKEKKRILRMDLPAFGLTGPNPERNYSIDYYNRFIDSFLVRTMIDSCILAGNSLGGGIAWHQAMKDSIRIKRLVLIDASGYPRKKEKGNIGFKMASMPGIGPLLSKFTPKWLIKKSLEDVYADKTKISTPLIDRYYDLLLREGNRQATLDIFRQRRNPDPEKIRSIKIPTLILWGEKDQLIDVSNAALFHRDIFNSTLVVLPNSGHVPMEESPDEVEEAIRSFLKD
jgi:pimeloyl-ACP methyl ester carboxylesterase